MWWWCCFAQIFWDRIKCGGSSTCGFLFGPSVSGLLPPAVVRKIETTQVCLEKCGNLFCYRTASCCTSTVLYWAVKGWEVRCSRPIDAPFSYGPHRGTTGAVALLRASLRMIGEAACSCCVSFLGGGGGLFVFTHPAGGYMSTSWAHPIALWKTLGVFGRGRAYRSAPVVTHFRPS